MPPIHPRLLLLRTLSSLFDGIDAHARSSPYHWSTRPSLLSLRKQLLSLIPQPEGETCVPSNSPTTPPPAATPTSHPDILRSDILDLLSLITRCLDEGCACPGCVTPTDMALIARCRAHISTPPEGEPP